jgi:hypothetical protein
MLVAFQLGLAFQNIKTISLETNMSFAERGLPKKEFSIKCMFTNRFFHFKPGRADIKI